ncbi:carboxypeptidase [Achlya hypogyna]|uniref:Carboxypeptidase n=1 Tax=Achlya hypogyna TaxID=1202772 RepID=A0A0A7CPI2_ACHHY|nr:secreted protein [Achlya hypogyna]OQR84418.1 carboxypeptidase [Achlya hypogyna]
MKLSALFAAALASVTAAAPIELFELNELIGDGRVRTTEQLEAIQDDADVNRKCHTSNSNYLPSLAAGTYTASTYHNCFRTDAQVFEYLDVLVKQNPTVITKFQISSTFKGLPIWAYRISTGKRESSLYFQALLHAREWVATSSTVYTISAILDNVAAKKPTPADNYDLVIVPIVNIDGYKMTWNGLRYQRKNANEVDLNRNWYTPIPNPSPPSKDSQEYPGPYYFSEKESIGIRDYLLKNRKSIDGFIDLHSYAAEVMAPFGDTKAKVGGGLDEKYAVMNSKIAKAMSSQYKSTLSWKMYLSYGCFQDYAVREFTGKPSLTIEMDGTDFVAPASSIKKAGKEVFNGLTAFAAETTVFLGKKLTEMTTLTNTSALALTT